MGMLVGDRRARSRPSTPRPRPGRRAGSARWRRCMRLIAKVPTIAAFSYRHSLGLPYVYPENDLGFTGELPLDDVQDGRAEVHADPVLERALDVLFILHADHEQNCSRERDARDRLEPRRSVLRAGRRGGGALRPAARRRERGGAADAGRDRRRCSTSRSSSSASRRARAG